MIVFTSATDTSIVDAIIQVIQRSLQAMTESLYGAMLLLREIFANDRSKESLNFILDHLRDLLVFVYDLFKPANVISGPSTVDADRFDMHSRMDNPYNELDLWQKLNRLAIIYQVQRVALTLLSILQQGRKMTPSGLGNFHMNASLPSDLNKDGTETTYVSKLKDDFKPPSNERWLFINGIANELVWFQSSCDKIRDAFNQEVIGVYNRSEGILWDLIECVGEHSAATDKQKEMIEHTPSSKAAQNKLEEELKKALWPGGHSISNKVVMIAHSQGCLILRLVLQKLVSENPMGTPKMHDMKKRLRVFTFGNPSIDWRVMGEESQSLSEYAHVTEHFAHEADFVAMLGVVRYHKDTESGYGEGSVFLSNGGRGHLFGAHYPLEADAYINGSKSTLLLQINK
ncbi:hypothetical protein S40285_09578 [Stachybotrys chlorohalonatus IBT 40285]|uniref:DUF676 domain-containing protein n=1 Tax=Stachybotrys chlorohalonatus (strain IBT 40285) TaxID=1283841 RepID=A0A084Q845_STAC4|nr:hypothetical protein S40285_09578 [Stachybotrys chlorohalonata IBT 40285]